MLLMSDDRLSQLINLNEKYFKIENRVVYYILQYLTRIL